MMNYLHQAFCQEPPIFLDQPAVPHHPHSPPQTQSNSPSPSISPPAQSSLHDLRAALKQKLTRRYDQLQRELADSTDRVLAENTLLIESERKVKKGLTGLRAELDKVTEERDQVMARNDSLEEQITKLKSGDEIEIDRFVIPQGERPKQLMTELVNELAIQDCIYAISKAFEKGNLDLNTYLRAVRDQAKKEFISKALILKIKETGQ